MKQKIEIEVEVPEGYEPTGEYRHAKRGEFYLDDDGLVTEVSPCQTVGLYPILRKVEQEEPLFKSFEIDWKSSYDLPVVKGMASIAEIGRKVGNYRIFGFGNRIEFSESHYAEWICTPHGNCKYAYGRLEK